MELNSINKHLWKTFQGPDTVLGSGDPRRVPFQEGHSLVILNLAYFHPTGMNVGISNIYKDYLWNLQRKRKGAGKCMTGRDIE